MDSAPDEEGKHAHELPQIKKSINAVAGELAWQSTPIGSFMRLGLRIALKPRDDRCCQTLTLGHRIRPGSNKPQVLQIASAEEHDGNEQ
jgi:hypothetical protein